MEQIKQARLVPIGQVRLNPNNPRGIKDEKYRALVKSIRDFPEMLTLRPIVVNADFVVLGGNMRLRACEEAGLSHVWVVVADELTPEQQREFIIKDNLSFGYWDDELIANEWDVDELREWGMSLPGLDDVPDYSEKNEEVDSSHFEDKMTIKLEYTEAEYYQVKEQLSKIAATPEQAIWILLGNE